MKARVAQLAQMSPATPVRDLIPFVPFSETNVDAIQKIRASKHKKAQLDRTLCIVKYLGPLDWAAKNKCPLRAQLNEYIQLLRSRYPRRETDLVLVAICMFILFALLVSPFIRRFAQHARCLAGPARC